MEEYDKTLLRLEDISFDEIGKWEKAPKETSDYLSNGCCVEYLTLILKASLFRSEKHMLEGNRFPADDINGAVESAVKYITGGDLMNDVATLCLQDKKDSTVVFKLTTWAPVVFTFLTLLGKGATVSKLRTLFGLNTSNNKCIGLLLRYWSNSHYIEKISKGQHYILLPKALEKLKWNDGIRVYHNSFCHSLTWLENHHTKQKQMFEFMVKTKHYASQGKKGRGNGKIILPKITECFQQTKRTSLLGKGVIASTKCIEKIGKKLKNTSLTDTHLNEITSSSDSSKNVKEDSVDKRQMESDRKDLNPVQFRMKYSPIKK